MRLDDATRRVAALLVVGGLAGASQAQVADANPDWKEAEVPVPALSTANLVPIAIRRGSVLRWGVDPASISIAGDGVVRYVVVAQGEGGATNAMFEGLRCSTGEVKVYARSSGGPWAAVPNADWKPLHGNAAALHSLAIARDGACIGHGANRSAQQIARDLRLPQDERFRPELR